MAIPAYSGAAQAPDPSAQVREASGKGSKGNKQGEATDGSSFLQLLERVKGSEKVTADQAGAEDASLALQLLSLLTRLDPAQLEGLAQGTGQAGTTQGEQGQLLTLLRNLSSGADISGKGLSGNSEQQALLREILMQTKAGEAETNRGMERLLSLMQGTDGNQGSKAANGEHQVERILSLLTSGEGQDKLSEQVLRQIGKDLESLTARHRTGADSAQLGRLAAELQQAQGKEKSSGPNLARLFLDSFSVEGKGPGSGKSGGSSQQQNVSLLQSLAREGQLGAKGVVTQAETAGRGEGGNPGVSTKAGEWANLFSTFQSTASGSTSLTQASASQGTANITDSQALQQMISKFQAELQRGSRQITMKMHPPELGRVQLSLISEDSGLQAHLQVQNAQVQGILERNMAALRQALEQQNLDFDQIQVSVESGGDEREEHNREERDFRASDWRPGGNALSEPGDRDEQVEGYVRSSAGRSGISLRV